MAIELNKLTNHPVIGISHTGHLYDDSEQIKTWEPVNVVDQVEHKVKFIEKHLFNDPDLNNNYSERDTELILIGHSVGCYVILETLTALNKSIKCQVKKSILLFPTIERMSETPNGKVLTFATRFFRWFIYLVAYLSAMLPKSIHDPLVNVLFTKRHSDKDMVDNAHGVVLGMSKTFACVRSCFHMGHDEMKNVKKLNRSAVEANLGELVFYYGKTDKWCPIDYYHDMKTYVGSLDKHNPDHLVLDNHGLEHAFVLYKKQCSIISNMIKKWIE